MTILRRATVAALLASSLTAPLVAQTAATRQAPTGSATTGKRLYTEKACYYCHGTEGQGGDRYPRIARVPRSADNFIRYLREPARMAAYSERQVSDAQLRDIYAFLRSLPEPQAVQAIPLLEQLRRKP